jgi:hypothetical protein
MQKAVGLSTLYSRYVAKSRARRREFEAYYSKEELARQAEAERGWEGDLALLRKNGVLTVADLIEKLPRLPNRLKQSAIHFARQLHLHQALPALLKMVETGRDHYLRILCADALAVLKPEKKVREFFHGIAERELASDNPDPDWLEVVLFGLVIAQNRQSAALLLSIFERSDLPGWLRGDAGDKIGLGQAVRDRRTRLFSRCTDAALRGLDDESIDVKFWSMYIFMQIAPANGIKHSGKDRRAFSTALKKLRKIAANDHRLAPGFWWPMSAEAEDAIASIEGRSSEFDAGERWKNKVRGKMNRD